MRVVCWLNFRLYDRPGRLQAENKSRDRAGTWYGCRKISLTVSRDCDCSAMVLWMGLGPCVK